ncbi:hypothetical protein EDD80_10497 [Anseongella ginsenosidimutans]|uniref:Uncharacterized protein n=1 Tax=Anseongella ginsenosidimutans TaxID=496056 RepID=A0A4R3KS10_9SPHI|nr:hypothetical protein [Anseongella ginsenosidimutans]QEC53129.1 hypothetical protein FRZ59_12800 [Anseongella ginsenosidimutans]TCS87750.1 hypothetical protein EDD80_10497 [Anseongella ginsenosidimutans]
MRSKLRPLAIGLFTVLLAISGSPILLYFWGEGFPETKDKVFVIILLLLFFGLLGYIIWFTLLIRVDKSSERITFTYPFRCKRRTYHFNEVYGFRFRYLRGRIDYKAIQFKTLDGRKFIISDFETTNLREIEQFCFANYTLLAGKTFRQLDEAEKLEEINKSRQFDISQAKGVRFSLYITAFLMIVWAAALTYGMLTKPAASSAKEVVILVLMVFLCTFSVLRINKINKQLKSKAEYAGNEQS